MKKKGISLRGTSLGQSSQSRPSQVVKSTEVYTLSPYITSSHRVCARNYNNIQVRIMQLLANIFQPINLTRPNVYLQYLKSVNAAERLCSIPFDGDVRQRFALKTHNWRLVRMTRDVTCLCCCDAHLVFLVDHRSRKFTISSECEVNLRAIFQIFRIPT